MILEDLQKQNEELEVREHRLEEILNDMIVLRWADLDGFDRGRRVRNVLVSNIFGGKNVESFKFKVLKRYTKCIFEAPWYLGLY